MYERTGGTKRLASALYAVKDDNQAITIIAEALRYLPQQLKEDIQAINDYVDETQEV